MKRQKQNEEEEKRVGYPRPSANRLATAMFAPRYVKEAREIAKNAAKLLRYRRDLLKPEEVDKLETRIMALREAAGARDREAVQRATKELEESFSRRFPPQQDAGWRENCEVFLVAIVIAIAVRSYFLQPFTIPTGSMQPTLNGVIGYPTVEAPPNILTRIVQFAVFGRSYVDLVSKRDDQVVGLVERPWLRFFTFTTIQCRYESYRVYGPARTLEEYFGVVRGRPLRAGEIIARGYINTGDHVFVDKVSYNFRRPERGEVFVFRTTGIHRIEETLDPRMGSQYYIKRLAGLPGDKLQIDPPDLFVNGELAKEPGLQRVMKAEDGYRGYSNGPASGQRFSYLNAPDVPFRVPEESYFALGDNSYYSFDSRGWGIVPERNLVGHGLFVYWPFTAHWGLIR